jgi:hypothetical protein
VLDVGQGRTARRAEGVPLKQFMEKVVTGILLGGGRTKKEILRCLKRYIARKVFPCLLSGRPASVGGHRR